MNRRNFITGSLGVLALGDLVTSAVAQQHEHIGLLCLAYEKPESLKFGTNHGTDRDVTVFTPPMMELNGRPFDTLYISRGVNSIVWEYPINHDWLDKIIRTRVAPHGRVVYS